MIFLMGFFNNNFIKFKYTRYTASRWVSTEVSSINLWHLSTISKNNPSNIFLCYHNDGLVLNWFSESDFVILWLFLYLEWVLVSFSTPCFSLWVLSSVVWSSTPSQINGYLCRFDCLSSSLFLMLYITNVSHLFLTFNSYFWMKYFARRFYECYHYVGISEAASFYFNTLNCFFSTPTSSFSLLHVLSYENEDKALVVERLNPNANRVRAFLQGGVVRGVLDGLPPSPHSQPSVNVLEISILCLFEVFH